MLAWKLAVIVSLVGRKVCIVAQNTPLPPPNFCSLQHCRKSAYDCSQLYYINAICDQQYNDLFSYAACCINTMKSKLQASSYPIY